MSPEIRHENLQVSGFSPRFDHGTLVELYDLGVYFKFPKFKNALIDLGTASLNQLSNKMLGNKFEKSQIDELLAGVNKAYAGDMYEQAALRSLYVAFFTQCYSKLREDLHFHRAIQPIRKFSADLWASIDFSDSNSDSSKGDAKGGAKDCAKDGAKGKSKDGAKGDPKGGSKGGSMGL